MTEPGSTPAKLMRRPIGLARKVVSIDRERLVEMRAMHEDKLSPLIITPAVDQVDLASWARDKRALIEEKLAIHGAIAFRGFNLVTAEAFHSFIEVVIDELMDSAEHTPVLKKNNILRPGFYPNEDTLLWHNEKAYGMVWPHRIALGCEIPAQDGGVSLLIDSRTMVREMDPDIREKFRRLNVMYVRNYSAEIGRSWQQIFNTEDKGVVEATCRESLTDFEWLENGRLRTRKLLPAICVHPITGEEVWFNQVQHWHSTSLDPSTRASLLQLVGEEGMPRNCFFGDGSLIDDSIIYGLNQVATEHDNGFLLERGDAMLLDNVLVAHGRTAYSGERKVFVAMGQPGTHDQLTAKKA